MARSKRCQPCIAHHNKCDGCKPQCQQCQVSGQTCSWPSDKAENIFLSEIKYASGHVPRPRGPRTDHWGKKISKPYQRSVLHAARKEKVHAARTEATDVARRKTPPPIRGGTSTQKDVDSLPHLSRRILPLRPCLSQPLIEYARTKYVLKFLRHGDLGETEHEGFVAKFGIGDPTSKLRGTLDLALSATALAYFGQSENSYDAIMAGMDIYQQILERTRMEIANVKTTASDELILLILILADHDNKAGFVIPGLNIVNSCRHLVAISQVIRDRYETNEHRSSKSRLIENIFRRRAVKMYVNAGVNVHSRLQNSAIHFDNPASQLLHHYMIELADVNAAMQNYVAGRDIRGKRVPLEIILKGAQKLDAKMITLQSMFDRDERYCTEAVEAQQLSPCLEPLMGNDLTYRRFTSIADGYEVLLFWASRLQIKSIIVNALDWSVESQSGGSLMPEQQELRRAALAAMEGLSNDIFETVPYFLGAPAWSARNWNELERDIDPVEAGQLTFALNSLAYAYGLPEEALELSRQLLLLVGRVNATRTFRFFHGKGGHSRKKFIPRVWPESVESTCEIPTISVLRNVTKDLQVVTV